jgi:redox-sensing transcriptional repressor
MATAEPPSDSPEAARAPCPLNAVPAPAVRRLSLYLQQLEGFLKQGRQTISSRQLGESLGYTDAQVRKDLAYFGQFGHPGIGYQVEALIERIRSILGTDRTWSAVVVGAGHLGQALFRYRGFVAKGFELVAIFDTDPAKIGSRLGDPPALEVLSLDRLGDVVRERGVEIGIVTVPAEHAQEVTDLLLESGVRGILNFAPASLVVPDGVPVTSVALAVHLEQLAFRIRARRGEVEPGG